MVRADNDEEQEELMQRETVRSGHKLRKLYWLAARSGLVRRALEKTLLKREIEIGSEKLQLLRETVSEMKC